MKSVRLRYIHRIKDRYGQYRLLFAVSGATPGEVAGHWGRRFFQAYAEAMSFGADKSSVFKSRTFSWLIEELQNNRCFLALSASTRTNYRRILINMQWEDYAEQWSWILKRFILDVL